jgi:hypothetical protein
MNLEFVRILEMGGSRKFPRIPDTLRIVLILWSQERSRGRRASDRRAVTPRGRGPGRPMRRAAASP